MCLADGCEKISRRTVVAATALLPLAACAKEPALSTAGISHGPYPYDRDGAAIDAYVARPRTAAKGTVIVFHGNAGLPADVTDTAIWAATHGYVGLAVSSTSRYPDLAKLPTAFLRTAAFGEQYIEDARAGWAKLRAEGLAPEGRLAVFGYCGGGHAGLQWGAGPHGHEVNALVGAHVALYNGRHPNQRGEWPRPHAIDLFRKFKGPVQLHQGGADVYTPPADLQEVREVARAMGKTLEMFVYEGAYHGFPMHTSDVYRPEYARLVQSRAASFLGRFLG